MAVIYAVEEHPFTSYPDMLLPVHNVVDNNDCFTWLCPTGLGAELQRSAIVKKYFLFIKNNHFSTF